jgi:hypothetical protein
MLDGTYAGVVEENRDPQFLGRLKVRVAHVYGKPGGYFGSLSTEAIPWALPAGLPHGQSATSGGFDWLPAIGDQVLIRFLDHEPEKPVWEGFMQTQDADFTLHAYDNISHYPKRGALTRYGHTLEFNESGLLLTTEHGYRIMLTDSSGTVPDGDITIETQDGQFLEFDDSVSTVTLKVNQDYYITVLEQMLADCGSIQLNAAQEFGVDATTTVTVDSGTNMTLDSGAELTINSAGNALLDMAANLQVDVAGALMINADTTADLIVQGALSAAVGSLDATVEGLASLEATGGLAITTPSTITAQFAQILMGVANEPFVKGATFQTFLIEFLNWASFHQHISAGAGALTSPSVLPVPVLTEILSTTILGQ